MAKTPKTTAKYTTSHDRMTISCKFADGTDLRINSSRWRDSLSTKTLGLGQPALQAILKFSTTSIAKADGTKELNGERFERVAKYIEQFDSVHAFAASLQ